jgi:hypothetical protein
MFYEHNAFSKPKKLQLLAAEIASEKYLSGKRVGPVGNCRGFLGSSTRGDSLGNLHRNLLFFGIVTMYLDYAELQAVRQKPKHCAVHKRIRREMMKQVRSEHFAGTVCKIDC